MTDSTDIDFEATPGETAETAAQQVAIWARNLSCSVEDAIADWHEHGGRLDGDTVAGLHSHKRWVDSWLRTYERLSIAERQ